MQYMVCLWVRATFQSTYVTVATCFKSCVVMHYSLSGTANQRAYSHGSNDVELCRDFETLALQVEITRVVKAA